MIIIWRETDRDRQRDRETETDRQRGRERLTDRERDRDRFVWNWTSNVKVMEEYWT